ncbi:MAG: NADH-quinone oxidoreductase subunit NuoK [Flammeovirgaceae bacterium]|nr:NADH-quinone oxidoreductase subunit NuoK [Flammeovirgaceae bacterium]MDW8287702.1 NADH-quinone oxidoreductase subunit NuoK [Flammeovirgaceae bacterium]
MGNISIDAYLYVAGALFCIGLAIAIAKKNAILVLMGIELMLNATNINLVAFSQYDTEKLQGQMFVLFIFVVVVSETVVALAIIQKLYHHYKTIHLNEIHKLKG